MFALFRWFIRRWKAHLRQIDKRILWPTVKAQAPDLAAAREMMLIHAEIDYAWSDLTWEQKQEVINGYE